MDKAVTLIPIQFSPYPHNVQNVATQECWWVYYILETLFIQKTDFIKTKVAAAKELEPE